MANKNARKMTLESLESRELKAGNVSLTVVNEELRVVGDNNANQVEIHQSINNIYRVTGLNGTKINGKEDRLISFKGGISVDLKGGDDRFVMGGTLFEDDVHGGLNILMGAGKDRVELGKVSVQGTTVINTDTEDDQVILRGRYKNLFVVTGTGNDNLNAALDSVRFDVSLGAGEDVAFLKTVGAEQALEIETGGEDDVVTLENVVADTIDIDTAAGADIVTLRTFVLSNEIQVSTGSEGDTVNLDRFGPFGGDLFIETAGGDDLVKATDASFPGLLDISTGEGNDDVVIDNIESLEIRIDTAGGEDQVDMTDVEVRLGKDIDIDTGDQNDIVRLVRVAADELFVDLGRGRDELRLRDSTFRRAVLNGGDDQDAFFDLLGNDILELTLLSFEN